jgi:hypothetical protein
VAQRHRQYEGRPRSVHCAVRGPLRGRMIQRDTRFLTSAATATAIISL